MRVSVIVNSRANPSYPINPYIFRHLRKSYIVKKTYKKTYIMASKVETSNTISLKGSVDIVTEFFLYSINNILYQRSIYPPESFRPVKQYGLTMMFTTDEQLNAYLNNIVKQLEVWLMEGTVQKLVLVVKGIETKETLERWVFECTCTSKDKR